MSIGTHATARMLADHFGQDPYTARGYYKRAPKGFKRIGDGCYRVAFLEKSTSTVYKIGEHWCNAAEAANARRLSKKSTRSLGFELVIPATRTYRVSDAEPNWRGISQRRSVVAQEFAANARQAYCPAMDTWMENVPACTCKRKGLNVCLKDVHDRLEEWSGLSDIHGGNVLLDNQGRLWFIDLAS